MGTASSDSNAREDAWARHYRVATERRRARGWHRVESGRRRSAIDRKKVYWVAAAIFVAITTLALFIPR